VLAVAVGVPAAASASAPLPESAATALGTIEFSRNSAELSEAAFVQLRAMAASATDRIAVEPGTTILVEAAAQKDEKAGLGSMRAALVRAFLMAQGLAPDRVRLGATDKAETGVPRNRPIAVSLLSAE
jgi:phage tail sheath gpL-like